ncbi:hypothetical protein [Candidatus Laterigemmans baculatus]|uniref:hypothetical protein n=1 Tax=Candidatus Laterigemmans baculatus TaxID=2770505 RepID=UPI0013DCF614|nr:hypothetical protein [Candidatus Laterigemmans baculatus]
MRAILGSVVGTVLALYGAIPGAPATYGQEQGFPSSAPGVLQTTDGIMLAIQSGGGRKPLWYYNGRYGVQGNPGERFSVYLYNPGPGLRKFVVTLDGINIIDGSRGSISGKGYILQPGEAETIRGWRDGPYYREFVFNWRGRDVARLLGQGGNQGTLGLAVWDGQITRGPLMAEAPDRYRSAEAAPMPESAPADSRGGYGAPGVPLPSPNDLGVDSGGRVLSPVRQVTFQPTALVAQLSLFYATQNALQQVGASRVGSGGGYIPMPQPYESARPPFDQPPYSPPRPPQPPQPTPQPWGGNPFPQDAPSVFRD